MSPGQRAIFDISHDHTQACGRARQRIRLAKYRKGSKTMAYDSNPHEEHGNGGEPMLYTASGKEQ
jgi:hypothetical protein